MRTFKLTIAYDGTDFAGWQIQPRRQTVQGMLERALVKIARDRVPITGSGRTDSGVHAFAQVASCQIPNWRASAADLLKALNANLPPTIVVTDAVDAPGDFHAIRDAIGKRYRYQLQMGAVRDPFDFRYRWHLFGDINIEAIQAAVAKYVGCHDFASFQASGSPRKTTTRTVKFCEVIHEDSSPNGAQRFSIEVEANGFLYNMVRNMVGTLVEIGRYNHPPSWLEDVILMADRDAAGPTAPPQGLFLKCVHYRPFQNEEQIA